MTQPDVFSSTVCALGEGPLWHPERAQLFWFDILGKRLLSREGAQSASGSLTNVSPQLAGSITTHFLWPAKRAYGHST